MQQAQVSKNALFYKMNNCAFCDYNKKLIKPNMKPKSMKKWGKKRAKKVQKNQSKKFKFDL